MIDLQVLENKRRPKKQQTKMEKKIVQSGTPSVLVKEVVQDNDMVPKT